MNKFVFYFTVGVFGLVLRLYSQYGPQNHADSVKYYPTEYYSVYPKFQIEIDDLVTPEYILEVKQNIVVDTNSKRIVVSINKMELRLRDTIILLDTADNLKYIYTRQRQGK
jgi:hypothetical protein